MSHREDNVRNAEDLKLDDAELARLMAADAENYAPPEGLLDRLLDEIPADLSFTWAEPADVDDGAVDDDSDNVDSDGVDSDGVEPVAPLPANDNWTRYRRWTVAAVLLTGLGFGSFLWRQIGREARVEIDEAKAPSMAQVQPAAEQVTAEQPSLQARLRDMPKEAPTEGAGANTGSRQAARRVAEPVMPSRAQDRKDDAGSTHDQEIYTGPTARELKESLEALAYVGTQDRAADVDAADGMFLGKIQEPPAPPPSRPASSGPYVSSIPAAPRPPSSPSRPVVKAEAPVTERLKKRLSVPKPVAESRAEKKSVKVYEFSEEISVESEAPLVDSTASRSGRALANDTAVEDDLSRAPSFFEAEPVNPFVLTVRDPRSTFGLDVDTGSYSLVRDYLRRDRLPPRAAVRVEEMLNYFDYEDPAPTKKGEDFAVTVDGAPSIYGPGPHSYLMRVGIQGRVVDPEDRAPALLIFVVDTSGSMSGAHRLGLVKESLGLLLAELRPTDRVALVEYGTQGRVLLNPTSDLGAIRRGIERLETNGSTNMEEGLRLAYGLAVEHKKPGEIHRVLLCSDGVANVGATTADAVLESVRNHARQGIELTTVGFGMGNYNDVLMERLADQGNGRYAYVDTLSEAHRIFVEDLTGTLQTLAAEARAQVVFDPEVVRSYRLLGYENRDIADDRFRDDTVDAGEIGAGHSVVALYELQTHRHLKRRQPLATVHLRYASVAAKKMVEQETVVRGADIARSWDEASRALRLASLVAEAAELLRGSYHARGGDAEDVLARLQEVAPEFAGDTEVAEMTGLVAKLVELHRRGALPNGS